MKIIFVQLYGEIDDLCNSRVLEELDYYMYDVKSKSEMIFYFTKEQTIFIVLSDDTGWDMSKLNVLLRTSLRENTFVCISMDYYTGYMSDGVWKNIKDKSKEFYDDPKTYRKTFQRSNKLSKLKSLIKRLESTSKDK